MTFRHILPLVFTVASLVAVHADVDRSKRPAPGPAPEASFPDVATRTLANGLKVFVVEDDRKPSVTFRLMIRAGAAQEQGKTGIASFAASLLNRGTAKRDGAAFAKEADSIGAEVEAAAAADAISVGAGGLTKYTAQLLDLLTDAALHPTYPAAEIEKQRKRVLSKLAADKKEPDTLAEKLTAQVIYGPAHPYGRKATEEAVKAITREDVVAFHDLWFAPNNAVLAVVGDVKADTILPEVEKAFAAWQRRDVPVVEVPPTPAMKGVSVHLVDRPGSVQSNVIVAQPGPARNFGQLPELNVLNATLGGGFSGRLFQNLREKHGYTYGAYSAYDPRRAGGSFTASAEVRNEVTGPALTELFKELRRIRDEPVPEPELALQREYNTGNYLLSLENSSRIAQRVLDVQLYDLPADFYKTYAKRMSTITADALQKLARERISVDDTAIVVVGEAKQIRPALEKFGPVKLYDTDLQPVVVGEKK